MYELGVQAVFSAAHAIRIRGEREPLHGHDWLVRAVVRGKELDAEGLLCDFHAVESALREVLAPFRNTNLNTQPPFADSGRKGAKPENPTAECVARVIADRLVACLRGKLPPGVSLARVSVTEAPGCEAVYVLGAS
jgi:6-pyruvoyltetrahydropterin/6-carboxytetrahydropterin synthase